MNKNVSKIFAAIKENQIIAVDTNLKEMHQTFEKIVPGLSYQQLQRSFKKSNRFSKTVNSEVYWFEMVQNPNQ